MKEILLTFSNVRKNRLKPAKPEAGARRTVDYMNKISKGATYTHALYERMTHRIDGKKASIIDSPSGRDIASFDAVYQRLYAMAPEEAAACAIYLKAKGVPFVDSESDALGFWGKLAGYWRLWAAGLPVPKTFFVGSEYIEQWIGEELERALGLPAVMKSNYGLRGRENYLVDSPARALSELRSSPHDSFIFQEFIPNDYGYRIWVCGNETKLVIERRPPQGSHLNNARDSVAKLVDKKSLPPDLIKQSVQAAQTLGRQIAGVDVIVDKREPGKHYFLEVNRSPQLITRANTKEKAEIMDEYLRSLLKDIS